MIKFTKFMLIFFIILFSVISVITIISAIVLYKYSSDKIEDSVINGISSQEETEFFALDRTQKGDICSFTKVKEVSLNTSFRYKFTPYNEIPQNLINAFISTEDKRFYEHSGIDYKRSALATLNLILFHQPSFGGSTITQQLVKNLTGNNAKKIERKLSEAFTAMDLEERYDKSEILEMYLNIINLSHGCYGVGSASDYYFSKSADKLTLCESAAIVAITNNPSKFDPIKHPEENKSRREIVLKCMLDQGYISKKEYFDAINEELKLNVSIKNEETVNSWYIDTVIEDVIFDFSNKYGISKQNAAVLIYKGGYKIYTAMDEQLQQIIEDYFQKTSNFPKDEDGNSPLSSMIIIDPHSGDILAIAGNIGKKQGNRIQNFATSTKRPPGSTIKPLSVYAPAFEKGLINWSSIVEDSPLLTGRNNSPWPSNSNNKYLGEVNIKYAISNSLNTVAVKVLHKLGNEDSFKFIKENLRLDSYNKDFDIGDASLALGQPNIGVSLRELTAAYSIFQNGIMCKSKTYYKVTDSSGRIVLENQPEEKRVISDETATIMTKLLQTVVSEGTACGYIDLGDVEVAGKTGTTQYTFDRYFIGYTPSLLAGVWQGYEYPKTINCFGGNYSVCIWNDIMNLIYCNTTYANTENKKFPISKNVKCLSYNKYTTLPPNKFDDKSDIEEGWFNIKNNTSP